MLAISAIARKYGLSRSTLLYYDRLGLVRPTYRTAAGYRLYQEEEERRLALLCEYRRAGIALREIGVLLDRGAPTGSVVACALEKRIKVLNLEIAGLRSQQEIALALLRKLGRRKDRDARSMTKEKWVALLRTVGLTDSQMMEWHAAFETQSPEAHQDFLESLGIPAAEIRRIRQRSAKAVGGTPAPQPPPLTPADGRPRTAGPRRKSA